MRKNTKKKKSMTNQAKTEIKREETKRWGNGSVTFLQAAIGRWLSDSFPLPSFLAYVIILKLQIQRLKTKHEIETKFRKEEIDRRVSHFWFILNILKRPLNFYNNFKSKAGKFY